MEQHVRDAFVDDMISRRVGGVYRSARHVENESLNQ